MRIGQKITIVGAAALLMCISIAGAVYIWLADPILAVHFLDVGQGDSIVIRTPRGQTAIIDGGDGEYIGRELGRVLPWYERTVDLMVLTHPHADHVAGLIDVLRSYRVRQVMFSGVMHVTPEYQAWLSEIRRRAIPVTVIDRPFTFTVEEGIAMDVIHPYNSLVNEYVDSPNNASVVVKLRHGTVSFLLPGDLESAGEETLLTTGVDIAADIIKLGHHGSDTSTSQAFLAAVHPQYAVISVGADNAFGHPSRRVLRRLERAGIQYWRTDKNGHVSAYSDGETVSVVSKK